MVFYSLPKARSEFYFSKGKEKINLIRDLLCAIHYKIHNRDNLVESLKREIYGRYYYALRLHTLNSFSVLELLR